MAKWWVGVALIAIEKEVEIWLRFAATGEDDHARRRQRRGGLQIAERGGECLEIARQLARVALADGADDGESRRGDARPLLIRRGNRNREEESDECEHAGIVSLTAAECTSRR